MLQLLFSDQKNMHNLVTNRKQVDCQLSWKTSSIIENTITDICLMLLQLISLDYRKKSNREDIFEKTLLSVSGEGSVNILFCFDFIFLFSVIDVYYW